ncbi:Transcriptional regulator, wHTH [Saccharolobus shibatae B12]|uniref:Transcriptional regulator, wHTH n=1 Tax=Saccharolobus shibatae (strain ATCC 51178 / DSM 5389 / JCM 8931 / NBRC 15437 / B12) TaxID=523848 RepID=A0A8F5GUH8_SACSH|nr:helix-turn-helix transcriptional regulator [Saccharolobus shibatae]QXJ27106.1 Transcriptional regulator, wHTH [Saccharolobus shibatae B12]QXJ29999.1 Transcriptional regulator, wHTH [Saccharolobus shibatae B12]
MNSDLEEFLSTPLKLLLIIAKYGDNGIAQYDLIYNTRMSSGTVLKHTKLLAEKGLIQIIETKTEVGSKKKIFKITEKGKKVVEELNKLMNEIGVVEVT